MKDNEICPKCGALPVCLNAYSNNIACRCIHFWSISKIAEQLAQTENKFLTEESKMRKLFKYLSVLGWAAITVLNVKTAAEGGSIPNGIAILSSLMCFLFAMALLVSEYIEGDSE